MTRGAAAYRSPSRRSWGRTKRCSSTPRIRKRSRTGSRRTISAIPADVKPIVDAYVTEGFDFLALRLQPGAGVAAMRPVRVSSPGGSPVLPLRMVSAGTGPTVGITLWVIAEGRYETQNFPYFIISGNDLTWDWATSKSDYSTLRAQKSADGRTWELESSVGFGRRCGSKRSRTGIIPGRAAALAALPRSRRPPIISRSRTRTEP